MELTNLFLQSQQNFSSPYKKFCQAKKQFFFFYFFFLVRGKMAKSFIDVVQDSPRTGLGIPVKTKKKPSLEQIGLLKK